VLGKLPQKHEDMIKAALDCLESTIADIRIGGEFAAVYDKFQGMLKAYGFSGLNLYGPAHGTGLQECEGPWVDNRSGLLFERGMVFNVDVWIADDKYGVRFEDGIALTRDGVVELTSWGREIMRK
jgi:Xaa-Pro aminopeptidase